MTFRAMDAVSPWYASGWHGTHSVPGPNVSSLPVGTPAVLGRRRAHLEQGKAGNREEPGGGGAGASCKVWDPVVASLLDLIPSGG